jgi:hypothetical protein
MYKKIIKFYCSICNQRLNPIIVEAYRCACAKLICRRCDDKHFCKKDYQNNQKSLKEQLAKFEKSHNFKDKI